MLEKFLAKRHIRHLDLTAVRAKAIEKFGWAPDQADSVEQEYRRFLYALTQKRREEIISPPSQSVDEFWHQHILDTRKYRNDCQKVFGCYMDHIPALSQEQQSEADRRRRRVYADHGIDSTRFDFQDGGPSCGGSNAGAGSHHAQGHSGEGGHAGHSCDTGNADGSGDGGNGGCGDGGGSGGDGGSGCGGGASCGGGGCGGGG